MSAPGLLLTAKGEVKTAKVSISDSSKGLQLSDITKYMKKKSEPVGKREVMKLIERVLPRPLKV